MSRRSPRRPERLARGRAAKALPLSSRPRLALAAAGLLLAHLWLSPRLAHGQGAASASSARPAAAPATAATSLSVPFVRYRLPNGLTVILHEDHAQPLVAVHLSVAVGSRDERAGRTGFAHLFEHLMFMGTERVPLGMFDEWMERQGAWNNASTSNDFTSYYEVGPSHCLPLLLWLEADRLSVLGEQIDGQKLDAQREIVRNERRQEIENQPYAKAELRLPELLFAPAHPYHHPIIGSHADVVAASVQDVRAFFARWYSPGNATLVVAGDFDPKAVRKTVQRTFGAIPARPVPHRAPPPAAPQPRATTTRDTLEDQVTLPMLIMAWNSPALYAPGDAELDLAGAVLSTGKGSRLYKALVYEQQIAQSVTAYQRSLQLGSWFVIEAVARPGISLEALEQAIDTELQRLRQTPVSPAEIGRAKNEYEMRLVTGLQSLAERASTLAGYQNFVGDPGYLMKDLARYQRATPASVHQTLRQVLLPTGRVILQVVPAGATAPAGAGGQR